MQKELPSHVGEVCQPEQVLDRRQYVKGTKTANQVLIKWTGVEADLATWEDEQELQSKFLAAPAWGQAGGKQEGNVTDQVTVPDPARDDQEQDTTASQPEAVETGGPA